MLNEGSVLYEGVCCMRGSVLNEGSVLYEGVCAE